MPSVIGCWYFVGYLYFSSIARGNSIESSALASVGLPQGPLIIGYQSWSQCNLSQTLAEVENGVNVVIWFAINLIQDEHTRQPVVQGGPNYTCVAEVRKSIAARNLPTAHLISIGGWDAPHPNTSFSGDKWFDVWKMWNLALPLPFDGFDWDLEGNDVLAAPSNTFTAKVLNLVVDMSTAAKKAGFVVTIAPPQSYLDPTTGNFSLSLTNAYPDWHPDFHYHSFNSYAYLLAAAGPKTFDLIIVQLYETWSRADQALLQQGMQGSVYLQLLSQQHLQGWVVDFGDIPGLRVKGQHLIRPNTSQLVLAFSFGSANGNGQSAFLWTDTVGAAYKAMNPLSRPRGFGFWSIRLEGSAANGTKRTLDFASGFNAFLRIRHGAKLSVSSEMEQLMQGRYFAHFFAILSSWTQHFCAQHLALRTWHIDYWWTRLL